MKHFVFSCATILALCMLPLRLYAQLEVETNNNVKISKGATIGTAAYDDHILLNIEGTSNGSNTYCGLKSCMKTGQYPQYSSIIGLYGVADASPTYASISASPLIGVCGKAHTTSYVGNKFAAGIAGVTTYYGGTGVYGGVNGGLSLTLPDTLIRGCYAGYFAGTTRVTGTMYAAAYTTTSDTRLKENIRNLNDSAISNILLLRPVEYQFKPDPVHFTYEKDAFEMKINHYGLLAQEVQKIYPNIVYEDGDGYLSINYTELIPVLIKSVQELSSEVSALKAQIVELQAQKK